MSASTWGSQTDLRPTQPPSTASTKGGWRAQNGAELLHSPAGNVQSKVLGREDRLVGMARRRSESVSYRQASESDFRLLLPG